MGRPGETPAERRRRLKESGGWIGVDFDGTLVEYHGWKDGALPWTPIPAMLERVRGWRRDGIEVRIFTARVGVFDARTAADADHQRKLIQEWCVEHVGEALPVTATKDFMMIELWDDRAVQVVLNEGTRVDGLAE